MHNCALVIGCADGVWNEVEEAKKRFDFDCFIAINSAGTTYPGHLDHWVSFHVDLFNHWVALRERKGFPKVNSFWTALYHGGGKPVKHSSVKRILCNGGSSGLIGAMVGAKLAHKVVLAGIPMDPKRAHFDKPGDWHEAERHRAAWKTYLPQLQGKVESMSGWTKELLKCQ